MHAHNARPRPTCIYASILLLLAIMYVSWFTLLIIYMVVLIEKTCDKHVLTHFRKQMTAQVHPVQTTSLLILPVIPIDSASHSAAPG